ncbi:hypothetical protein BpHYR1_001276 [Brachionus plicatilis]|uniref:Uncharacterized protein n=1 Tax=Brachionus plicatilis TaxID=10195 RepID=A0A3M7P6M0_BRAPC|nr:hypothetical protein BpHYR1_001276 [Brachionus plicatilis]
MASQNWSKRRLFHSCSKTSEVRSDLAIVSALTPPIPSPESKSSISMCSETLSSFRTSLQLFSSFLDKSSSSTFWHTISSWASGPMWSMPMLDMTRLIEVRMFKVWAVRGEYASGM